MIKGYAIFLKPIFFWDTLYNLCEINSEDNTNRGHLNKIKDTYFKYSDTAL